MSLYVEATGEDMCVILDDGEVIHAATCDGASCATEAVTTTQSGRFIVWSGICPVCGEDTDALPVLGTGIDADGTVFDGGCVEVHEH